MTNKAIQLELDKFEQYILMRLFGDINNIRCSKKIQLFLIAKNIKIEQFINEKIQLFEYFITDYIDELGIVDGDRLTKYIITNYPSLKGWIALPSLKLSEYAQILDSIIGFEALGKIIQNF